MGPLQGVTVVELGGLGPGPYAGMLLADMGADVILVEREAVGHAPQLSIDIHRRGKKSLVLDLKAETGREALLRLIDRADAVFEGFRPGVMEKLGLGPRDCMARNRALVYGRMTGWGQDGPLAQTAGHDINYLAITGALHAIGLQEDVPVPPLNLVGDYAGGTFMALGLVSAILHARQTGSGQVVDAAMVDSTHSLMSLFHSLLASGLWKPERHHNFLDGAAHFYRCYETADGQYVTLGAIEPPFMKVFAERVGLDQEVLKGHMDAAQWPEKAQQLKRLFLTKTQDQWTELLQGSDACYAPVVPFWKAHEHPHNHDRQCFVTVEGIRQPAPAPRFSQTPSEVRCGPVRRGDHTESLLKELGFSLEDMEQQFTRRKSAETNGRGESQ